MRKKILLLVNETAGRADIKDRLLKILTQLTGQGCLVTVYPVNPSAGLVSEDILQECGKDYDVIACCGGDGTLNHVINGILHNQVDRPIGYIPAGSANDFSKNIYGDASLEDMCRAIAGDTSFAYDIGKLNSNYFNYIAAFGAFTKVSYDTSQAIKNLLGYSAYVLNTLVRLPENLSYSVSAQVMHDGQVEQGTYIFCGVTNTTRVGGFEPVVLSDSTLNDGYFEVELIRRPANLAELTEIVQSLSSGSTDNRYIQTFKTDHIVFQTTRPVSWTIDGEFGGTYQCSDITVHKKAIRIMVNPGQISDRNALR